MRVRACVRACVCVCVRVCVWGFAGEVPLNGRVCELSDAGQPIVVAEPNSPEVSTIQ